MQIFLTLMLALPAALGAFLTAFWGAPADVAAAVAYCWACSCPC